MQIGDMSHDECVSVLKRTHLGHLGCAQHGQPYVTPIFFAYDDNTLSLYSVATFGRKVSWMRANPLVCLEIDEIEDAQRWLSVIVFGIFEELPDTPDFLAHRQRAYELLQRRPMWWEPAYVRTVIKGVERPLDVTYFRVRIDTLSGRHSMPDPETTPKAIFRNRLSQWFGKLRPTKSFR